MTQTQIMRDIEDTLADLALADGAYHDAVEHSWHAWRHDGRIGSAAWDRLCLARDLRDLADAEIATVPGSVPLVRVEIEIGGDW